LKSKLFRIWQNHECNKTIPTRLTSKVSQKYTHKQDKVWGLVQVLNFHTQVNTHKELVSQTQKKHALVAPQSGIAKVQWG